MKRLSQDSLTGSYARDALSHYVGHFAQESRRTAKPFSLAMIDLDHFKSVNDAFGHARGDEILRNVAERIEHAIRDEDLLFRYGGDEFVLLLPFCDKAEAARIAGRVLASVEGAAFSGEPPVSLTLSVGVATFPEDAADGDQLFDKADARAFLSKRLGRGRVVGYDEPRKGLHFDDSGRLLGRENALEQVQSFLLRLPDAGRGVLELAGPDGAGVSRFLREIARNAALRRYAVLAICGNKPAASRLYGALSKARFEGAELPASGPDELLARLGRHLGETGQSGLLVTVDEWEDLDPYSRRFVDRLLHSGLTAVGLAYHAKRALSPFGNLPLAVRAELPAFTSEQVKLWLRGILRSEPQEALVRWLAAETAGLPSRLQTGLLELERAGLLAQSGPSWTLGDVSDFDLRRRLEAGAQPKLLGPPSWDTLFVGRAAELEELRARIAQNRLVTILGEGGIGKSRLAAQCARELAPAFPDGVAFVSLADLRGGGLLAGQILRALEIAPAAAQDPNDVLMRALAGKELLLVLDAFEHVLDGAPLVADLVARLPRLRVLATSREALRLPGESRFPLTGLELPAAAEAPGFANCGAVLLFLDRAGRAGSGEVENGALLRICRLTGGVPLALELAASWTAVLSCEIIAEELAKGLAFLEAAPGGDERLRGVAEAFWRLLSEVEQESLSRLALFQGGFSEEAARSVAGASLFFLLALADRSFLRVGPGRRYRMHEPLRRHALDKFRDAAKAREEFASRYAEEAGRLEGLDDKTKEAYPLVDADFANFAQAMRWASESGRPDLLHPLAVMLRGYCDVRGRVQEGLELFSAAQEALGGAAGEAPLTLGWLLESQALFCLLRQQLPRSVELAQRARSALEPIGASEALALCFNTLGIACAHQGEHHAAQDYFLRAKVVHEATGNAKGVVQALGNHAVATGMTGDIDAAMESYQAALEKSRELHLSTNVCSLLCNIGQGRLQRGDNAGAMQAFEEALALAREIAYSRAAATALEEIGHIDQEAGKLDAARDCFEEALALYEDMDNADKCRTVALALTETLLSAERPGAAQARLSPVLAALSEGGPSEQIAEALLLQAELCVKSGDLAGAARLLGSLEATGELGERQLARAEALRSELAGRLPSAALGRALQDGRDLEPRAALNVRAAQPPA